MAQFFCLCSDDITKMIPKMMCFAYVAGWCRKVWSAFGIRGLIYIGVTDGN